MLTVEYMDTRGYYWTEFVEAAEAKGKMVEAASDGDLERVKALADAWGGGPTTMDEAMSGAAEHGHLGVVQWLARQGATNLHAAARSAGALGHSAVLEWLTKKAKEQDDLAWKAVEPRLSHGSTSSCASGEGEAALES